MEAKTWTNELVTNNLKASIKMFWNKKRCTWMACLNSTNQAAPKFITLKADEPSFFNTAKTEARKIFAGAVA